MRKLFALAAVVLCPCAFSQIAPQGLEAPWDVKKLAADLARDLDGTQTLLNQIDPQHWIDTKGAPSAYIVQAQTARQQVKDAQTVARSFAQKPENLSAALDTYFRLEALEFSERALTEGAREYDARANADRLSSNIAHNFDSRQRLRQYAVNLATSTEENYRIADSEAQRCRAMLNRQQPSSASRRK